MKAQLKENLQVHLILGQVLANMYSTMNVLVSPPKQFFFSFSNLSTIPTGYLKRSV